MKKLDIKTSRPESGKWKTSIRQETGNWEETVSETPGRKSWTPGLAWDI
jgi:hypothetical protein